MPTTLRLIACDTLLAACGGDGEVLAHIVDGLHARIPLDFEAVQVAFRARDMARVKRSAHKLYGMISAVSTVVAEEVERLEEAAERAEAEQVEVVLERLRELVEALLRELPDVTLDACVARVQPQ